MSKNSNTWSFRAKFLVSSIIATLVIPTISGIFFFQGELSTTKEFIFNDSVNLSENIAHGLHPTLVFDDLQTASEELNSLISHPQINSSTIWKKNSESEPFEFFCSTKESAENELTPPSSGEIWSDDNLLITRPIKSGDAGEIVGMIQIERSLAHLTYKKDKLRQMALTSWTFMIIVILFVTIWYQNSLTRPLKELTSVAEKISHRKNYDLRARKISTDEFGKLTDLFNEMLDSINDTNQKLVVANQNMEQRVERRTQQLTATNQKLLTEIKERERATLELIETRDRLSKQEKLASVGQVSSNIAHELRNPMAAIRNSTYFLRLKNRGNDETAHYLETIDKELSRSDEVIQRLLEMTKGDGLNKKATDLRELAREAMTYSNITGNADLSLTFSPHYFSINLDRILFRQVFCNLFLNAIQAMTGGGKITVLAKKHENGKIVISISDQGVGIKEGNMQKVFDPLFTDKEEGVGLGLSLCRDIVTRHGGKISAANNSKLGITIEIELPSQQGISEMNKHKKDVAT